MRPENKMTVVFFPLLALVLMAAQAGATGPPSRVVLVPFVITGNGGVDAAYSLRLSHILSKELDRDGIEAVRPFSPDLTRRRCQRMLERYTARPVRFARGLLRQYVADMVYVLKVEIALRPFEGNAYRARVRVVGQGYTREGGDVATVARRFTVTDATQAGAIEAALMRIRHGVGARIARWRSGLPRVASPADRPLHREGAIKIYLQGAPDDGLIELFDAIIRSTPGVKNVQRIRSRLKPRRPGESITVWRVELDDIDPFFIESNIMQTVKDHYAVEELIRNRDDQIWEPSSFDYLKWIRPGDASTEKLCFIVDWCAAGDPRCSDRPRRPSRCDFRRWHDRGFE